MKKKSSSSVRSSSRCFQNTYKDYEEGVQKLEPQILLQELLPMSESAFQKYEKEHPPTLTARIKSDGSAKIDPSVYTGSGGSIYVYWRIALYYKILGKIKEYQHYLRQAQKAFEVNLGLFEKKKRSGCASFFMSIVGPLSLGYILGQESGNEEQQTICLKRILQEGDRQCFQKDSEDQLLYGNAGYLYALLLVYIHAQEKERKEELEIKIAQIIEQLFKNGQYKEFDHLIYPFPKEQAKKAYLGGAHGLVGVLYLILKAIQLIPKGSEKFLHKTEETLLKETCYFAAQLQLPSGNYPSSLGKTDDLLVHFCHGAPGFIPFLCEAYKFYKDGVFKECALKAGECVWKKGILKKGNPMCHGIGGNSYMLHTLSTICEEDQERCKWKYRSLLFTQLTYEKVLQQKLRNTENPGRLVIGVPDSPLSLMEGRGGDICLYADVLSDNRKFPGFEI